MNGKLKLTALLSTATALLMLYGCSKDQVKPSSTAADQTVATLPTTHDGLHVYGLLPTPESEWSKMPVYNDAQFAMDHPQLDAAKAAAISVTLYSPDVRDQGQIGSCTGFAGTEAYEITYNYTHGAPPPIMSPAFLYYEERVNIERYKITQDPGADMVNIGQALEKYGITTEALMPYPNPAAPTTTAFKTAPTAAAISTALGYEVSNATLLKQGDTATVKKLLRSNTAVYFGFNVYDNTKTYQYFENLNTTSYTYNPLTSTGAFAKGVSLLGGHANVIIGFNDAQQAFWVENSWSTTWGDKGYYWLPYSVFQSTKIVPAGNVYYMAVK
jgi:C1A family cysteine protease